MHGRHHLPRQDNADKEHGVVGGVAVGDDQGQSIDTKGGRQPTSTEHARDPQLFGSRNLQGPGQRDRDDKDDKIGRGRGDSVGNDDGPLVEALVGLAFPVGRDGPAGEDFHQPSGHVVCGDKHGEGVDGSRCLFVRRKYSADDEEKRQFHEQGHGHVEDRRHVGCLSKESVGLCSRSLC